MPPLELEGDTLGRRHQHFNKLVEDTIANKQYDLSIINKDDGDIDNLLKIDIACKTRNVDFIVATLKSDDMLYVSKAIKKSTWLITEQQYADIINPEYLHTQLFPNMNTKAVNKLMLHIRLNLKDESRIEAFYIYLKEKGDAYKWLLNCSIPFIENLLQNEECIPLSLFKRLCKRSITFLAYYKKVKNESQYNTLKEILFLLKKHPTKVMNVLEDEFYCVLPRIGKKYTEILMKMCPQRILNNGERYFGYIDMAVVAKYIKKEEIKSFLYKQLKNDNLNHRFKNYNNLKHFVNNMPKDERFEFVKKTLIDKSTVECEEGKFNIPCDKDAYYWYEYAPFSVAFTDLKKLIRAESSPTDRVAILSMLITCARGNQQNIKSVVKYFYEKHLNEPFKFKIQFVNKLLTQTASHEFDVETWNFLDQLFYSMEVYVESDNNAHNLQMCLRSIILYKVLHDEKVPSIVEKQINFHTYENIQKKLNEEQKYKVFTYLLNQILEKIQCQKISNKNDFYATLALLQDALNLLKDWNKDIKSYPFLLDKIQELIKINTELSIQNSLSSLYVVKKSWRKHLFQDSLNLFPNEETCLNALKHGPQLLMRHDQEVEALRTNDNVSLRRLLTKIRVYWSNSLAPLWIDAYLQNLNKPTGQKALIKGLFVLLPQKQVIDMAKRYVPGDHKINWGDTDPTEIRLRQNIATNLHIARPMPPLDAILWYAKGDYLQYAVPSLNAILHNLSKNQRLGSLPKLLESPVSLQKFGIHLALATLESEEVKPLFLKIWTSTKNSTIRTILFKNTFDLLCTVKNPIVEKELWELLSIYIDNLSTEENKNIYRILGKAKHVPDSVQSDFFMKSYEFLTSLPEKANCEILLKNLFVYAPHIVDKLDPHFVVKNFLSPVEQKFCKPSSKIIEMLASFVLCGKTEEEQLQRYKVLLVPTIEQAFRLWNDVIDDQYYIKINFKELLQALIWKFRVLVSFGKICIPVKLFREINIKMEENITVEHYELFTSWKLATEYVTLIDEHKYLLNAFENGTYSLEDYKRVWMSEKIEKVWKEIHFKISPKLGPIFVKCLKEDTNKYFPSIWLPFTDAFLIMFQNLSYPRNEHLLETLKHMLNDEDFIPSYLSVCSRLPYCYDDKERKMRSSICHKILSHPSKEVQLHYHCIHGYIPVEKN